VLPVAVWWQCSLPNVTFSTKWLFSMGLPLAACAVFVALHLGIVIKKRVLLGRRDKLLTHVDVLIGV
jgi:hypothetical protein